MLPTSKRDVTPTQVGACLSGNLDAVDHSDGVIQLMPRLLEAAFDRASAGGHLAARGQDELHRLRHEREEVIAAAMFELAAGECMDVPLGLVHQMEALEDAELYEFSTQHFDSDSHRIVAGD